MKFIITIICAVFMFSLSATSFAKGSRGGNYASGKGSSHKGGQYVSPRGHRYGKH